MKAFDPEIFICSFYIRTQNRLTLEKVGSSLPVVTSHDPSK